MLEYFKTILVKVSFDEALFEKELKKAIKGILPTELITFKEWCYLQFDPRHQQILNVCFATA